MAGKFDINPQTGKQYGVNPSSGVQDDNYWANTGQYLAGGGQSGGGGGGNYANSAVDMAKQMYELSKQFQQPAINTLQESGKKIPQIYANQYASLEAQKPTLSARYDALLDEVKQGTRQVATKEFSQRGIPLSSGVVDQTVESRLAPQIRSIGVEKEAGLQNISGLQSGLSTQEAKDQMLLAQAIATIQASSSSQGIQGGLSAYSQQEATRQADLSRQLSQNQFNQSQAFAQSQNAFNQNISTQELALKQQAQASALAKANAPAKLTQAQQTQNLKQGLLSQAGSGVTLTDLVSQFGSGLDLKDIVQLYTGTNYYKKQPTEPWAQQYLTDW